jgi:hypothetical protein
MEINFNCIKCEKSFPEEFEQCGNDKCRYCSYCERDVTEFFYTGIKRPQSWLDLRNEILLARSLNYKPDTIEKKLNRHILECLNCIAIEDKSDCENIRFCEIYNQLNIRKKL